MNKLVAWMREDGVIAFHAQKEVDSQGYKWQPLYTHPVKELTEDGGKVCARCGAIAYDPVIPQTVKEPTEEEIEIIIEALLMICFSDAFINYDLKEKALAILRKAQEQ